MQIVKVLDLIHIGRKRYLAKKISLSNWIFWLNIQLYIVYSLFRVTQVKQLKSSFWQQWITFSCYCPLWCENGRMTVYDVPHFLWIELVNISFWIWKQSDKICKYLSWSLVLPTNVYFCQFWPQKNELFRRNWIEVFTTLKSFLGIFSDEKYQIHPKTS